MLEPNKVFFVATLHPNLGNGYKGPWLSENEQKIVIDRFYNERQRIPLSYEHINCDSTGYVQGKDIIGHVIDLFQGKNGDLMVKCQLSSKHPATQKINSDIIENKIKWGVSVGLVHLPYEDGDISEMDKNLMHVAFTTNPGFAEQNTFLHYWALSEADIDYAIGKNYFQEGHGKSYGNENFVKRFRDDIAFTGGGNRRSSSLLSTMSDPVTQDNQGLDPSGGDGGDRNMDTQMDVSIFPSNDGTQNNNTTFSYQPRNINKNNVAELEEERQRMTNHMRTNKKSLEDMPDEFIDAFQAIKKSIAAADSKLDHYLSELKDTCSLTEDAYTTVKNICRAQTNNPGHLESQQHLKNFAFANFTSKIEADKRYNTLVGEKRKVDDELALLKKNAADFEANKKSKPNVNYNAYQTYETSYNNNNNNNNNNVSPKPNRNTTTSSNNNNYNNNGQSYASSSSTTTASYEFPNKEFNDKFTQKQALSVTRDIQTVYLSSPCQNLFDLARISHNNMQKNV